MRKKFLFAVLPIFLLACNFLFPISGQDKNPLPATVGPAANQSITRPFVIVRINKASGDMMTQLASEAEKAKALGLAPFIEFDATWCPPCQAIEKSIEAKDPLTMQAFEGVYLIRADVDEWNSENGKDFTFDAIPVYYQLDAGGNPTGSVIDGGAWNEDIPENFAPVLDAFFSR
jgi:thiol-disulfide isomerase/thioredoxin